MLCLVYDAILLHLTKHLLLNVVQHGFTPRSAPITNLLSAQQNVSALIENEHTVDIIFWTSR